MVSKSISTVNDQKCPTIITKLGIWEEHSGQVNLVNETNPTMKQFPTYFTCCLIRFCYIIASIMIDIKLLMFCLNIVSPQIKYELVTCH